MKRIFIFLGLMLSLCLIMWAAASAEDLNEQDILTYCCSSQVFQSFEKENIEAFTRSTGIKVQVQTSSSGRCAFRMMNGLSHMASMAESLDIHHADHGYKQIPFCIDPIDIIVNASLDIENISEKQLQDLFSGNIDNWQQVGGPNIPVLVIVPGKNTAASRNFRHQVMIHKDIKFDLMACDSTKVIEAIQNYPGGAVSFISHGAVSQNKAIKSLRINYYSPTHKDYPYEQRYYYVTNGEPTGIVEQFIDHSLSEKGRAIIDKNGMVPLQNQ